MKPGAIVSEKCFEFVHKATPIVYMRFGGLSPKLDLNSQLHKSLDEFAREQLQQSHFLFFGNADYKLL